MDLIRITNQNNYLRPGNNKGIPFTFSQGTNWLCRFYESQKAFRAALCDSFNTPVALDVLRELVSRTNVYINSQGSKVNADLVETIALWISRMLRVFGLGEGESIEIGWGQESKEDGTINVRCSSMRCSRNLI